MENLNLTLELEKFFWEEIGKELESKIGYHPSRWSTDLRDEFALEFKSELLRLCNENAELNFLCRMDKLNSKENSVASTIYNRFRSKTPSLTSQDKLKHRFAIYLGFNSAQHFIKSKNIRRISQNQTYAEGDLQGAQEFFSANLIKMKRKLEAYDLNVVDEFLIDYENGHNNCMKWFRENKMIPLRIEMKQLFDLASNTMVVDKSGNEVSIYSLLKDGMFFLRKSMLPHFIEDYLNLTNDSYEELKVFFESENLSENEIREFYLNLIKNNK